MDYVFFAFSSLCLGFVFLLAFLLANGQKRVLSWWHLLTCALVGLLYYYLEISIFRENLVTYYLFNLLPQGLLLISLGFFILRHGNSNGKGKG